MATIIGNGYTGTTQPLTSPRVCYQSFSVDSTSASGGSAAGTYTDWVTDGETWSVWTAGATTTTLNITFGATAVAIDYVGIAAHTLGSTGADVQLAFQLTDGGAYVTQADVGSHTPAGDGAILWLFDRRDVFGVQVQISGGTSAASVAVFQAGQAFEFPRASTFLGLPISEAAQISYRHQRSIRGDVLGRTVEGAELQFEVAIANLPETFRTGTDWQGFKAHVQDVGPFFIAPKPAAYTDDVAYARLTDQPRFNRDVPNRRASGSVALSCMGYLAP